MSMSGTYILAPLVVIPARMASSRLPGKPLADICGVPMIVHVLRQAEAAGIGPVVIACAEAEIKRAVEEYGGQAILTDPALPSGTDRVKAAADLIDPDHKYNCILNVQGDMPTIDPACLRAALSVLEENPDTEIATLVVATQNEREKQDPNVVKAVLSLDNLNLGHALYFTRANAPFGDGPVWHHIGIYAYRREALDKFCALPPSPLERRERLEQLRALEAGMRIDAGLIDSEPHGVDTPEDLQRARAYISAKKRSQTHE